MKIYIKTWGCSANQSDSEIIAGLLVKTGHEIVQDPENADLIILNTCVVKNRVEVDELRDVEKFKDKKLLVTGCMPQIKHYHKFLESASLLGLSEQDKVVEAVDRISAGERIVWLSNKKLEKVCFPKIRKNKVIEICQISTGCASNCSFCATKLAKGKIFSFSEEKILSQIKSALEEGCKEIWLTSQDCGAYGLDRESNLPELLKKICSINSDFLVRVGMLNPQWAIKYKEELIKCFQNDKIFKFLHIPVQSGSDVVLKHMNRAYSIKDFKATISDFRKAIPNLTISTDIICGYPTETEQDWKKTISLIKWLRPDVINISQFWPRPGTKAAELKQLPGKVKKARSRELTKLYEKIGLEKNKAWVGWEGKVLIDELGPKGGFVGRNFAYKPILLKSPKLSVGSFINTRIVDANSKYLIGRPV